MNIDQSKNSEKPKIYNFMSDFVFKYVFGQEKNKKLLICLLNALLSLEKSRKIADVTIINPFNEKEFKVEKLTALDIKATDQDGKRYNIEVQVESFTGYVNRAVYYLTKLHSSQLCEAEEYDKMNKSIGISILGYRLFPELQMAHSIYKLANIAAESFYDRNLQKLNILNTLDMLNILDRLNILDILELHFIELPKIAKKIKFRQETPFEKWLHILKFGELYYDSETPLPEQLEEEEGIKMAIEMLRAVNADEHIRARLEAEEKFRRDVIAIAKTRNAKRFEKIQQKLLEKDKVIEEQEKAIEEKEKAIEEKERASEKRKHGKRESDRRGEKRKHGKRESD